MRRWSLRLIRMAALTLLGFTGPLSAEEKEPETPPDLPLSTLFARSQGLVQRPALFEWRRSDLILGLQLGQPIEYNNFNARHSGLDLRLPADAFLYRSSFVSVEVKSTAASRDLDRLPFLQAGRPSRFEWQNALELPLSEGIASPFMRWIPLSEYVLSGVLQLSTALYGKNPLASLGEIFSTRLSSKERDELEASSPESMRISEARHDLGFGMQWDTYFKPGINVNLRLLYHLSPLADEGELRYWLSFSMGLGYAL